MVPKRTGFDPNFGDGRIAGNDGFQLAAFDHEVAEGTKHGGFEGVVGRGEG